MPAKKGGSHRRSRPAAWFATRIAAVAVLLVAGAFGVGQLVSLFGTAGSGAATPAVIRPSADQPERKRESRGAKPRRSPSPTHVDPRESPSTAEAQPRTERRVTRSALREQGRRDRWGGSPSASPTAEATSQPTEEPTSEPTSEPAEEPTSEPTEEPDDEPTDEPTDDGLLPPLPGDRSGRAPDAPPSHGRATD